ncbi:MAG: NAD(P)/FAD-dependent oxidoreductase [Tranquillimonas sp.]
MNLLTANDRPGLYPGSWYAATATPPEPAPPLRGEVQADICIVGAGYTGLSAALHLAGRGYDVVLLDAHRAGWGASGRNGGQVGTGQRQGQAWLERRLGADHARRLWQIGEEAKALTQDLVHRHAPEAGWSPGIVHADRRARDVAHSHAEAAHLARRYGYDRIEPLDRDAIGALIGSAAFAGGSLDRGAGHLHPLRLAFGLARAARAAGLRLFEGTTAGRIEPRGGGVHVATDAGGVRARHAILAANGYLGGLQADVAVRVMPINNFIVATEPLGARADDLLRQDVAVADSRFVVNYWRLSEDRRLLFGGGESYGYRFPADIAAKVRRPMLEIYPQLRDVRITHAWGGTLAITRSRMPYFAQPTPNVWSASGYSGHGVAMALMAGRILSEALAGQAERFDVMARVPVPPFPGGTRFRSPLLALAMSWFALRDRLGL